MTKRYAPQDLLDALRLDANESALFEDDLRQLLAKTYDKKYPDLTMRGLVPAGPAVNPAARNFTFRSYDGVGLYEVIEGYARNLPRVDLKATEHDGKTRWIGNAFGWNKFELMEARFAGLDLPSEKAFRARRVIEEALDYMIAFGIPTHGITGFFNNANVTASSVATVGSDTTWADKVDTDPELVLADIREADEAMRTATKEVEVANTLALPPSEHRRLRQTNRSGSTDKTLLDEIATKFPNITSIVEHRYLETAGSGGTKRFVLYKKDAETLGYIIPQEFMTEDVYRSGAADWEVACFAKTGGVMMPYPLAVAFRDGL